MNGILRTAALASLVSALIGAACSRGPTPVEFASPTATGIPSPLPASYAWVRAHLDGALRGEFVTGDPQDSLQRLRGRVRGEILSVEIGYDSRGLFFETPPLRGGSRYVLRSGEGRLALFIEGMEWSTDRGGVCSVIFNHVRGAQIPFDVPPGDQIYEADAGFVCAALRSEARPDSQLSVIDGSLHFFFLVSPGSAAEVTPAREPHRTSTGTIPPTG